MPKIILQSPIGEEAPYSPGLSSLTNPRAGTVAFLFNGHVSVLPFWKHLQEDIQAACEPSDVLTVVKPNTFAPASASQIQELSQANLALVGV